MSLTRLSKSDLKPLLRETMARYPQMNFDREFQEATLEDWLEDASSVGLVRFSDGVKRARTYSEFFPHRKLIRELIPDNKSRQREWWHELRDLEARKLAGEKFYSLADVFIEFCRKVEAGEIKGRDQRGQKALEDWAQSFRGQEKKLAAKLIAEAKSLEETA